MIAGTALVAVLAAVLIAIVVVRGGGEKVINAGGDTVVLVGKESGAGLAALGRGTLADVGGCLGWAGENGEPGTVVVWPHGTNVETPEPLRVKIKGSFYELGDTVEVGGGYAEALDPSSTLYQQAPQTCRDAKVWLAN